MPDSQQTVRVFISSPGDVVEERNQARRVIDGLQRQYPGVTLQPVLWEELALPATASFQETIDVLLERHPIHVAVFILWSRLGSPLGAAVTRQDGSPYRSGTEREFDMMLAAFEQSGRQRPVILAYARDDDAGFKQKLTESPRSELQELIEQRELADAFIREQFQDAEGHNVRALQSFREPVGFAQRLRVHVRHALDGLLGADAAPRWLDDPYRGLQVFDEEHAAIFHGRDEETCDLLQRLRDQHRAGCAFVVIVGASGSGKSSLARAGVAANLVEHAGEDDVKQWRVAMLIPGIRQARQDESDDRCDGLCSLLTGTLANALPELGNSATALDDIAAGLAMDPALTVRLSISHAFARASTSGAFRLLLVLDQLEELWTDRRITAEDREQFLLAIEALARSGHVAVLATLRSDFYPHAQQMETFLRLKGERGHFDLLPPGPAALGRLITEPARLAGVRFEQDEHTGRSLDEIILQDAARDPSALPLLQYTLDELYRQRDEANRQLTYAAYGELGGVEGALSKRAEEVLASLPLDVRATLSDILPLLITVDTTGDQSAVRRRASLDDLTTTPERATLTNALITARLLITDRQDESPIASLAHEALLRRWDRIANWITANRDHLRLRARLEQSQQRWESQQRDNSLLLPLGLPLEEARQLLTDASHLLTSATDDYVRRSLDYHTRRDQRTRRRRRIVITALSILTLAASVGGLVAWRKQREADTERGNAVVAQQQAQDALEKQQQAEREGRIARANALQQATPENAEFLLRDLDVRSPEIQDTLRTLLSDSRLSVQETNRVRLALLKVDRDQLNPIVAFLKSEGLLNLAPQELRLVRSQLTPFLADVQEQLEPLLSNPARRLPVACLLAEVAAAGNFRATQAAGIADDLLGVNPIHLGTYQELLRPMAAQLVPPLSIRFVDPATGALSKKLATSLLAEYVADDAEILTDLVLAADPESDRTLFPLLRQNHRAAAVVQLETVLQRPARSAADGAVKEALALKQAAAVTALLRLDATDEVWPVFAHKSDVRVRSHVLHRMADYGVAADTLQSRLPSESDASSRAALILGLGELARADLLSEDQKTALIADLSARYRDDPHSGVHGAAEWSLRQCGAADAVAAMDRQLQGTDQTEMQWSINGQGQTMVRVDGGEFRMGSPLTEEKRDSDEVPHQVRIGHGFLIATKEVTRAQWRAFGEGRSVFSADSEQVTAVMSTDDSPMVGIDWYDSAWYCNWLSEQEGIPEEQWCYQPNASGDYEQGMQAKSGFQELRGYRLPTEAEWEYACRGGTSTAYSCGESPALLGLYGWFRENSEDHGWPVGSLRPNDLGLFDMHGSVSEWCGDWNANYAGGDETDPSGPSSGSIRVIRGGSWIGYARDCRSANRLRDPPDDRSFIVGFRVLRSSIK